MSDPIQQPPNAMNEPENIPTRSCYNCGRELTFGDTHFNPETAAYSLGESIANDWWRADAVAHGHAEYYLDDKHERQWRWKP